MWSYSLENFSYIALAFGQRQLLLSLLGFIWILIITWLCRRTSVASLLPAWLWFWVWMLPLSLLGSSNPGIGIYNDTLTSLREYMQHWLPQRALSPCDVPYLERLSSNFSFIPQLSWQKLVLGVWLLAAAFKSIKLLIQRRKLFTIVKSANVIKELHIVELTNHWIERYRIRRPVSVRSSDECTQAFTMGVFRPIIYLPDLLIQKLPSPDIEIVLGHELAHIKRYDDVFVCFQLLTKSILFFNPFIWLSARRITSLRERCCDLLAIQTGDISPHRYADSLLRIAELQQDAVFDSEAAAGLTSSALAERVGDVLKCPAKQFSYLPLLIVIIGLFFLNIIFMPNLTNESAIRGQEAKILLSSIQAVAPMPRLLGNGNFIDGVDSTCGQPTLGKYHPGADFVPGADGDRAIHAIAAGEIVAVTNFIPHAEITVRIRHANDMSSTYVHLSEATVRLGEHVSAGQPIGELGDNHLHLELRKGVRVIDPSVLLRN